MDTGGNEGSGLARGVIGSTRVIAFGASNVAPASSVVAGLVIVVSSAGYASPLVVLVAFAASLCCASSIAEFARRLPSAGSLYTYSSRGLGRTGGFLTGWLMVFAYVLYVPAGVALTSTYMSQLLAGGLHLTVSARVLFVIIVGAVALLAYLGIKTSSSVELVLVVGEVAIIAALAVTILVSVAPANYPVAVLTPGASPNGQFTDIANAMIYGITAFAGFEAATALGEEARNTRRSVPASTIGVVVVTGIFYLLVIHAEVLGVGRQGIPRFVRQDNPLGYLASRYWSPSAAWIVELVVVLAGLGFVIATFNVAIRVLFAMGREQVLPGTLARLSGRRTPIVSIAYVAAFALVLGLPLTYRYGGTRTFGYIAGAGGLAVVLVYLAVNIAVIRAFRTGFRDEFSRWRHLIVPAAATGLFLFPLWGILHPRARQLADLLHFTALGWLGVGVVVAVILRARRPATFETLGKVFVPAGRQPEYEPEPGGHVAVRHRRRPEKEAPGDGRDA